MYKITCHQQYNNKISITIPHRPETETRAVQRKDHQITEQQIKQRLRTDSLKTADHLLTDPASHLLQKTGQHIIQVYK